MADTTIISRPTSGDRTERLRPAGSSLEAWTSHDWQSGVQIENANALDAFVVRTANSTYEITVLSPATGDILVRGGAFFPVVTKARLAGASLGGSFLKRHGIYVGFRLEFVSDQTPIVGTDHHDQPRSRRRQPLNVPSCKL
jgi:hypothetical protein